VHVAALSATTFSIRSLGEVSLVSTARLNISRSCAVRQLVVGWREAAWPRRINHMIAAVRIVRNDEVVGSIPTSSTI